MCYTGPIVSSIIATVIYRKKKTVDTKNLCLMFYGASIFGFIDHLWNGELFLISDNIGKDLLLGVVISACVLAGWALSVYTRHLMANKPPVFQKF